MNAFNTAGVCLVLLTALPVPYARADSDPATLVVTATRHDQSSFDLPMAIDLIDRRRIQMQQSPIGVSEVLNRVPGVMVQNRETFAQEQQIVLRGFGARSQFGVRGVKLLADGIPANMPDGQGGSGLFDLASAERIEVLRGPFSALYGNHSGGVVQLFSENGSRQPTLSTMFLTGSYASHRSAVKFGGQWESVNAMISASRFDTEGYREWSSARKDQLNAKIQYSPDLDTALTVVANSLDQPNNLDPLGLTAGEMAQNRRQANATALTYRTRRNLSNTQGGAVLERALGGGSDIRAIVYAGERSNEQYLAFPGTGPTSSGGVSTFQREFWGGGLRWTQRNAAFTLTAGADYERSNERRRGYVNNAGLRGALKRDEDNVVWQGGAYAQIEWNMTTDWSIHGGLRYSRIHFASRDHYIVGANPDDSGEVGYSAWTPVAGVLYRLSEQVNLYANTGCSFEAPTFIELAYLPNGATGLNVALKPSISRHGEIGGKALLGADTKLTAAAFWIATQDEIVVDTNTGGRTTYRNAGATRRVGLELALDTRFGPGFAASIAATWLDPRFRDTFVGSGGTVDAGNHIPGLPARTLFAEVGWAHVPIGFSSALEGRWNSSIQVDDRNSEAADRYFVANLRAGLEQQQGAWRFKEFIRVDNLFNKNYVGAVYVNDGNGRYYAPAAQRNYVLGLGAAYRF